MRGAAAAIAGLTRRHAADISAVGLCALAWAVALSTTRDLAWPHENDHYRDMGAAQSILDGNAGEDPAYLGERWWYSPLVPAVVALSSSLSGVPLHRAYATFGTHLNLLAPLAFYALAAVLLSRTAALYALLGFLFLGHFEAPSWVEATYSPWLWSCNLAQAFLYAAVAFTVGVAREPRVWLAVATGVTWGLTALAHPAPALVLFSIASCVAVGTAISLFRARRSSRALVQAFLVAGATGLVVSSPFLWSVLSYAGETKNRVPIDWVSGELDVNRWWELVFRSFTPRGAIAAVGAVTLAFTRRVELHARLALLAWLGAAGGGVAFGWLAQLVELPSLFPSWHFYFTLQAVEAVLFGFGVVQITLWLPRLPGVGALASNRVQRVAPLVAAAGVTALVLARAPGYVSRFDLVDGRRSSLRFATEPTVPLYHFILKNSRPSDVFLAPERESFYAVQAAGRKVVAFGEMFANPYVSAKRRTRDAATMLASLRTGKTPRFSKLAERYRVKFVVVARGTRVSPKFERLLEPVSVDAAVRYDVFRVRLSKKRRAS